MTSHNPGSKIGREEEFQASMRAALESTTVTWICGFLDAMTAQVGAPICINQAESPLTGGRTNVSSANTRNSCYLSFLNHFGGQEIGSVWDGSGDSDC